jgi:hypothetical protein
MGNFNYSFNNNEILLSLPHDNLHFSKYVEGIDNIEQLPNSGTTFVFEKKVVFCMFPLSKQTNESNLFSIIYDFDTNSIDFKYDRKCYPITQIMSNFFDIHLSEKYYDCTRAIMIPSIGSNYFFVLSAKNGPLTVTKFSTTWTKLQELISSDKHIYLDFHNVVYYCKDLKSPFCFTHSSEFLYALWLNHNVFIRIDRVNGYKLHEVTSSLIFSDRAYFVITNDNQNCELVSISHKNFNKALLHCFFETKRPFEKNNAFVFLDKNTLFFRKNDEIFDIDEAVCEINTAPFCQVTEISLNEVNKC